VTEPYAGALVTQTFRERWLSGLMIGDAGPCATVEVRRGRLNRTFHRFDSFGYPVFGDYPGALSTGFWYPDWQPDSDWMTLDAIKNIALTQSFDNNGVTAATIAMDNLALVATVGAAGILYHLVEQGYYSPLRGYVGKGRPDSGVKTTPFLNMLPNAQIRIRQGYGTDAMVTTFLGLIDEVESDSIPNQLNLTARDFGGVLVDERFFGWAKEIVLPSPLTFCNRSAAENSLLVGGDAQASTSLVGYQPSMAALTGAYEVGGGWRSELTDTPDDTQWIEITVPQGRFSQIYAGWEFENMEVFIGIRPTAYPPNGDTTGAVWDTLPSFNGETMDTEGDGWWNPYDQTVPGHFGGWPYFATIGATKTGAAHYISLGGEFEVGDGTVVRIGLRNLGKVSGGYRAGVNYIQVNERTLKQTAIDGRYVLIDDVSDVVRCCLRWCGFKNWEIENTGVDFGLGSVYVADDAKTFMDVINVIKDMVGYTFFIGEPRDDTDDQDLGWPVFRNNRVMEDYTGKTEFIDDKLLLTDAKVTLSNADDHCIIRCRGIAKNSGVELDGDTVDRIMYAYIPAWANEQGGKQAGVLKPITHVDELFTRLSDCQFGCYLIALQIALLKYTAIIDLPGNPGIGLDTLQSVIERNQGLNSRIYVSNRTSTMEFGADAYWTLEIGGSLVDTPEIDSVIADYRTAIRELDRGTRNPWLRRRKGKLLEYGYQTGGTKP
jgi:hypothetical protein